MSTSALALVLLAAGLHAGWNYLAKRARGGAVFAWLLALCSALIYTPVAAMWAWLEPPTVSWALMLCIVATSLLQVGYFLALQRGYRVGDLSLVYPLARGTGPLIAALAAIVLFDERPSALALLGTGLIVAGVFVISGGVRAITGVNPPRAAIGYGLVTGVSIASYTLVDKYAVSSLFVVPLVYNWLATIGRVLILTPYVWLHRGDALRAWQDQRATVLGVAIMEPLAYVLVLAAMVFTPVSYVAPAREVSILIGVLLGARLLAERHLTSRLLAASTILGGVVMLVLG